MQRLLLADLRQALKDLFPTQRFEAELGAARRDGLDNARHIVADQTEARCLALLLHRPSEGGLSRMRHRIRLVQNDNLKRGTGLTAVIYNQFD